MKWTAAIPSMIQHPHASDVALREILCSTNIGLSFNVSTKQPKRTRPLLLALLTIDWIGLTTQA